MAKKSLIERKKKRLLLTQICSKATKIVRTICKS